MRYLFDEWEALAGRIDNKPLFIFLDFDGTLAPICATPKAAALSGETKKLLRKLSKADGVKIAIVSGRSLRDIKGKVGIAGIIYAGNHGLEMEGPGVQFSPLICAGYMLALKTIKGILAGKLLPVKGVLLEEKGISLALHYRLVDRQRVAAVKKVFRDTVKRYCAGGRISVLPGKKVLEVRPGLKWGKGRAVKWLLARQGVVPGKGPVFPVYVGDDLTDEDAFGALKNRGLTVVVGKRPSLARYYLEGGAGVRRFLRNILAMRVA
ncbi:MAG: trehalose-phosphatase [Candidatus Omnitrophota bacterium]